MWRRCSCIHCVYMYVFVCMCVCCCCWTCVSMLVVWFCCSVVGGSIARFQIEIVLVIITNNTPLFNKHQHGRHAVSQKKQVYFSHTDSTGSSQHLPKPPAFSPTSSHQQYCQPRWPQALPSCYHLQRKARPFRRTQHKSPTKSPKQGWPVEETHQQQVWPPLRKSQQALWLQPSWGEQVIQERPHSWHQQRPNHVRLWDSPPAHSVSGSLTPSTISAPYGSDDFSDCSKLRLVGCVDTIAGWVIGVLY